MNQVLTPAEVLALKEEIFSSLHCALPGKIVSFDASTNTAVVQPVVKKGNRTLPQLSDVPVCVHPLSEVAAGISCLLVFADLDIDAWWSSGDTEEPVSGRMHDLSDAFAFVGFREAPSVNLSALVDLVYPVGSIYMSAGEVSPAVLFPGTEWEQIKDMFILGAGDTYERGTSGGSTGHHHELSAAKSGVNLRKYNKYFVQGKTSTIPMPKDGTGANAGYWITESVLDNKYTTPPSPVPDNVEGIGLYGNTDDTNTLPPYLAVNIWKRTA